MYTNNITTYMKHLYHIAILLIVSLILPLQVQATTLMYRIDIHEEIGSTTWRYLQAGMRKAQENKADAVIIHLNTYGGTVLHADSMRTLILNSQLPVYAYIENNAASAGALIAIACDSIYMREGARIGAATVVDGTGNAMPDKYQSYMRATMRATAESHGRDTVITQQGDTVISWRRNPLIAEAMVDQSIVIPQLCDSGKVLTFTAHEALKNGYCEGVVADLNDMIVSHLHISDYVIDQYKPSIYDRIVGWLTNPALQAIMVTLIIGGIFFELKTPGIGLPSAVACIAAVLYFLPLFISGAAESWEILIFVLGIILIIIEFFVIPGFGVAGISGIVCMVGALILVTLYNVEFDFSFVSGHDLSRSIYVVLSGIVVAVALLIYISHRIGSKGVLYRFALHAQQNSDEGYVAVDKSATIAIGRTATTLTRMAPSGKIKVDGEIYEAISLYGQYIEANTAVRIEKYENNQLYVTPAQESHSRAQ